jgi:hypothetical protein
MKSSSINKYDTKYDCSHNFPPAKRIRGKDKFTLTDYEDYFLEIDSKFLKSMCKLRSRPFRYSEDNYPDYFYRELN